MGKQILATSETPDIDREIARAARATARKRAELARSAAFVQAPVALVLAPTVLRPVVLTGPVVAPVAPVRPLGRDLVAAPMAPMVPAHKGPSPAAVAEGLALYKAVEARPSERGFNAHVLAWARHVVVTLGPAATWAQHGHARSVLRRELSAAAWAAAAPIVVPVAAKGRPVDRAGFSGGGSGLRGRYAPTVAKINNKKRLIRHPVEGTPIVSAVAATPEWALAYCRAAERAAEDAKKAKEA